MPEADTIQREPIECPAVSPESVAKGIETRGVFPELPPILDNLFIRFRDSTVNNVEGIVSIDGYEGSKKKALEVGVKFSF